MCCPSQGQVRSLPSGDAMRPIRERSWLVFAVLSASCSGGDSPTEVDNAATSVDVIPAVLSFSALRDVAGVTATPYVRGRLISQVTVSWVSSSPSVASVSPAGVVTALADGTATITGTSGSASGTATVNVMTVH